MDKQMLSHDDQTMIRESETMKELWSWPMNSLYVPPLKQ